jgi:UDPglucose 6-dehydrogenase
MNDKNYNIGIVGKGFVGSAVQYGFSANTGCEAVIRVFDKDPSRCQHSLEEVVNKSDFIFVSVPTPSNSDGTMNVDNLMSALEEINLLSEENSDCIILIRSTIIPGTSKMFQNRFPKLKIVFNPEFLTERSAKFDFINQSRFILGGDKENTSKCAELYRWRFGSSIPCIETNFQTAELIKYMNNCFFATKVSFMNEMKQLSDKIGADWDNAVEGFIRDGRIGHSHINVPGHDGKPGFGGSCFPKDIQALISFGRENNIDLKTLEGAWEKNLEVRPEKDWENLKGRAVVKKSKD